MFIIICLWVWSILFFCFVTVSPPSVVPHGHQVSKSIVEACANEVGSPILAARASEAVTPVAVVRAHKAVTPILAARASQVDTVSLPSHGNLHVRPLLAPLAIEIVTLISAARASKLSHLSQLMLFKWPTHFKCGISWRLLTTTIFMLLRQLPRFLFWTYVRPLIIPQVIQPVHWL